jgi:hypothetical protein
VADRGDAAAAGEDVMALFLDVHHHGPVGKSMAEADLAHQRDLAVQGKYGVRYLKYWYDPVTGKVFCLSEAPNREAAMAVHREAHGAPADEYFEVVEGS